MKARIDYDLDYLRNWSLALDLYIIAKTAWIVLKGENAHYRMRVAAGVRAITGRSRSRSDSN
jgi:hypothetical protein